MKRPSYSRAIHDSAIRSRRGHYVRTSDGWKPKREFDQSDAEQLAKLQKKHAYCCKVCEKWHVGG